MVKLIVLIVIAIVFIVLAFMMYSGKGDKFIAGYNTMTEEERAKVDIKRLRLLMAITCVVSALFVGACYMLEDRGRNAMLIAAGCFVAFTVVIVILANTWAKKK
ncbi:MAG: DUF3784 domain-containing protein [Bacteroidales bacterium]|nr:DUF3784 domain-containing protein [Bacteroidales bacterium]